ncbi:solute carrier family 5 (low affinity glucose cotransporter), member 4-like protein [Natrialba magadii ATCC 43099]|uniref:Solute carrier family 5 (Low affinity glucose cotransporter), member 4-like protein n=1 Tax=Natrialba magadii (strain ATCC 43099 / DSM 3394 / CCM 3739 / CIP 104546 / IAM 13178 / JCM 8861 / NBRC 102185 / NCIMB 2190 / MS3) TaxID=547559 RepID=D3SSZ2_NATMM|nr:hypothetical protein [Natrialba magadii]ADD04938.1 solute carrier family 5 (low affinity glucose cotransporter), member 4-like protein [Natrialba magadii ATCC 43099]ELY23986.1 solute carrier family 5 (low affinity glucose cotransporter), member 4-like protein [Natrialba magadii ATCC 43099]
MELSPEEYGAYWQASIRVAMGIVIVFLGTQVIVSPLLTHPNLPAVGLGIFLFVAIVFVGSFLAMLGIARVVRTAMDVELRG